MRTILLVFELWLFTLALLGMDLTPSVSFADSTDVSQVSALKVVDELRIVHRDISWLEQEIDRKRKALSYTSNHSSRDEAAEIAEEVRELGIKLEKARANFVTLASEVELPLVEDRSRPKKRDLIQELQQFVTPLFDSIRRVSEKPRRIEGYRTDIFYLKERLSQTNKAISNLNSVISNRKYPAFQKQLEESQKGLIRTHDELEVQVASLERKLGQELQDHRTVMQVITGEARAFIGSEGKNLLLSSLVFTGVLWSLLFLRRFIFKSKALGANKTIQAIYGLVAGLLSIFSVLFTLHFLNDWFLVTTITLLLLTIGWASKALITVFITEVKLVLNLGSVKQGERVVWQGIPWQVMTLGFRSTLVNEALQGGAVALPATALSTMLSRSIAEGEPWFPTRVGDFVLLDDGFYGQVETQTPETVVVRSGKSRKYYSLLSFIGKNPQNFSKGFQLTTEIFVQYNTPPQSLETQRKELSKVVISKLSSRFSGPDPDFSNLELYVYLTGVNITRIHLEVTCHGRLAPIREVLRLELHSTAWEARTSLGQI